MLLVRMTALEARRHGHAGRSRDCGHRRDVAATTGSATPATTPPAAMARTVPAIRCVGAVLAVGFDRGVVGDVNRRDRGERRRGRRVRAHFRLLGFRFGGRRDADGGPLADALRGLLGEFAQLLFLLRRRELFLPPAATAPAAFLSFGRCLDRRAWLGEDVAVFVDVDDLDPDGLTDRVGGVLDFDQAIADDRQRRGWIRQAGMQQFNFDLIADAHVGRRREDFRIVDQADLGFLGRQGRVDANRDLRTDLFFERLALVLIPILDLRADGRRRDHFDRPHFGLAVAVAVFVTETAHRPEGLDRDGLGRHHRAESAAGRARTAQLAGKIFSDALAGEFKESERRERLNRRARAVLAQPGFERRQHPVARRFA